MDIVWFGESCFRLHSPHVSIVTDPYLSAGGRQSPELAADIVTISGGRLPPPPLVPVGGRPRIVDRPGEYEVKGAVITGVATPRGQAAEATSGAKLRTCVFLIEVDRLKVCHLGYLDRVPLSQQVEELSEVDVLLVPVGGFQTLSPALAAEVISMIEPRIVVPMLHDVGPPADGSAALQRFCRELGVQGVEAQARLSIARSQLPEEIQVAVLQAQTAVG